MTSALLIYAGIPLAVFCLVFLLVFAPSWTRSGRVGNGTTWGSDPLWLNGPSADPHALPSAEQVVGGGAHGTW